MTSEMPRYARKISVRELRPGMYVEALDRPWLETDYPLEGLHLESDADIERLRSIAEFVYVPATGPDGAEQTPADNDRIAASRISASDRAPRSFIQELGQARVIRNEAKAVVENVHEDIRAGRAVNAKEAHDVVVHMIASVSRHPDALVWFTNLKDRDAYTAEHSMNVCMHAISLATHIGEPEANLREMGVGALLHDVGKIKVPIALLNKPGKLNAAEYAEMKRHPEYGVEILEKSSGLTAKSLEIVLAHHERFNGRGYPRGLVGDQISHYSQLVAIADVYDAIVSNRVYQNGRSPAQAMEIMRSTKDDFNTELLAKFAESLGAYPVGSLVELNTGEVGFVVPSEDKTERPTILIVLDHKKRRYFPQRMRDLRRFPNFKIVRLLESGMHGVDVDDYAEWFD